MQRLILIFYAELMPYSMALLDNLASTQKNTVFKVFSYGVGKKLSNFLPKSTQSNLQLYDQSDYSEESLLRELDSSPLAILVSGRMEKKYLKIALKAKNKGITTICLSDAQYHGTVRQRVAVLFSYFLYRRYFHKMFVPGLYQYEYAKRLGFNSLDIRTGLYTADVALFNEVYHKRVNTDSFADFLFIGRFISRKSVDVLLEAYKLYSQNTSQPEKLILIGQGDLEHLIPKSPNIIVYNYLDQTAIAELMSTVKAFILPSRFEAWGVVVHEAAAAGMPIITTRNTGASTSFVKHNYNGRVIDNLNPSTLARSITFISELEMKDLKRFGKRSYELSRSITPELGAAQLLSLVKEF